MATKKRATSYTSEDITTLRFPDNVRANASMFMGSVDSAGVWLSNRELLDNGLDEHLAGRNDAVMLHSDSDGSYWVLDRGDGVPQGIKTFKLHVNGKLVLSKMPTMQAVFGELHTSGKYRSDAYATSVGTHGIGAKGTNATALFFTVWTCYKGKWYTIGFKQGHMTQPVAECKAPKGPDGKLVKRGTVVHFKPDPAIYTAKSFPLSMATEWAEIMAYINPGFSIVISSAKGRKVFVSKAGISEYITNRLTKIKAEAEKVVFESKSDLADVAVAFSNYDGCDVRGFTNGLHNANGGKHVDSVTGALYDGLKPFIKTKKVDGKQVPMFREADLKEGLVGLVNAKLHKAQFSSQDKAKLTDDRVGQTFEVELAAQATKFFQANKALAQRICERAAKHNELKTKFTLSKMAAKKLNALKRNGLPAKYAGYDSKVKVHDRELFIVEGDSAGGTVKEARFPYQAVLPLKGKIMNALKDSKGKTLDSEEILNILAAIGFDVNAADPYAKLQTSKIINLADPDPDGCHINTLLLTLYYRYLPDLYSMGVVYVADSPEFYAIYKGHLAVGDSMSMVRGKLKRLGAPANTAIQHIKGWGEISKQLMRILAMDPATRRLIRIKAIEHDDRLDFERLMNDDVAYRRDMLGLPSNSNGGSSDDEEPAKPARKTVAAVKRVTRRAKEAGAQKSLNGARKYVRKVLTDIDERKTKRVAVKKAGGRRVTRSAAAV